MRSITASSEPILIYGKGYKTKGQVYKPQINALNECIKYEGYMCEQEFTYRTPLTRKYNSRNY